ncbi:MAG: GGDEF domain-containing protein [Firmicutes bacterium]|nr:GGDEF domain-containing protein [Bacillota bacterium]
MPELRALQSCWHRDDWMRWTDTLPEATVSGVLFVDADFLKQVNDQQGHAAGDAYLEGIVTVLNHSLRQEDRIVRWGGDEFVLCTLSCTFLPALHDLRQRILTALDQHHLSCSIGIALKQPQHSWDSVIAEADKNMYTMKQRHHAQHDKQQKSQGRYSSCHSIRFAA